MKIVILDGYTLNPGDLTWDAFAALGELKVYERTNQKEILERAGDADIILTSKTVLDRSCLSSLPKLQYIGVLATGVNIVDREFAKEKGILVSNVPDYTGRSGAQMVFALLLELTNRVGHHSQTVISGKWSQSPDFCYWDYPLIELEGLSLGIVGFGGIGKAVARIAEAFGMKIIIHTRSKPADLPDHIQHADLDTLLKESDVISLHCPLTPKTREMINQQSLQSMKKSAYLINISRGGLIQETDLTTALNNDQIAGAALDVLSHEPADPNCPLFKAKNCYITPHVAWATLASRRRLLKIAADNISTFMQGVPQNLV